MISSSGHTGKKTYCTDDETVSSVGCDNAAGKMSPRNLLVTTVGDELHLATNFRAKVISVSLKDRASILPGGHTADGAYWFDSKTGRWITSTYYRNELPAWLVKFNATDPARRLMEQDWNTLYPLDTYVQSTADDTPYETPFEKGGKATFPVRTSKLLKTDGYGVIRETPYGNTMTLQVASEHSRMKSWGRTTSLTCLLSASLLRTMSATVSARMPSRRRIHTCAWTRTSLPSSTSSTRKWVQGNYTVFLTADHAAAHNVRFLADRKVPAELGRCG